ncbi:MAG TPA: hypothetical protein VGF18_06745 [Candidatus Tumulicola sp.]|jgi:hypothetical protein
MTRRLHGVGVSLVLLLAACNGGGGFNAAAPARASIPPAAPAFVRALGAYVYVTSGSNVDVFYNGKKQLKQIGEITGFQQPRGLCSNTSNDVFVTDAKAQTIQEFARGGTTPIATLADPNAEPVSCSFDPKTGNLAVANQCTVTGTACTGYGNVAVYAGATGTPTYYTSGYANNPIACAYDSSGDLFVVAGGFMLELAYESSQLENVPLNDDFITASAVQFDGYYITVTDPEAKELHRYTIENGKGIEEDSTTLHSVGNMKQTWIDDYLLFVAKDDGHGSGDVLAINYFSVPKFHRRGGGLTRPFGITVTN